MITQLFVSCLNIDAFQFYSSLKSKLMGSNTSNLVESDQLVSFLKNPNKSDSSENQLSVTGSSSSRYEVNLCRELKAYIWVTKSDSRGYELINTYFQRSVDAGLRVTEVFRVNRLTETRRYVKHKKSDNRVFLWHGSKTQNIKSIISNGLQIRPESTGSMFGRGIYFADAAVKSTGYSSKLKGFLVLAEVALGKMYEPKQADHGLTKPPRGFDSVKGVGKNQPNPAENYIRTDGVIIPLGKLNLKSGTTCGLNYNEYIVYDESRIKIQYLVCFNGLDICEVS